MTTIRIPTPLRPYTENKSSVTVQGDTAGAVLEALTRNYPELRQHLFDGEQLRSFVNIYLNEEDIRYLDGAETAVGEEDTLMIIPSIAGGRPPGEVTRKMPQRQVDQSALKSNQAFIIGFLLVAFIVDFWPLVPFVALVMLAGTAAPALSLFKQIYRRVLRPLGIVQPQIIADNPEPHRFAQGVGGSVLAAATIAFLAGSTVAGWSLAWVVIALAAVNLFLGFCAGCFLYYQLSRLGVPGFAHRRISTDG